MTVDDAGAISGDAGLSTLGSLASSRRSCISRLATTYDEGPWSFTAQARIIGSARLTNNLTQNQSIYTSIDNNSIPAVIYGDFRASYRWNDRIQLYARDRQCLRRTAAEHSHHRRWRHELHHL